MRLAPVVCVQVNKGVCLIKIRQEVKHRTVRHITQTAEMMRMQSNIRRRMNLDYQLLDPVHVFSNQARQQAKLMAFDIDLHKHIVVSLQIFMQICCTRIVPRSHVLPGKYNIPVCFGQLVDRSIEGVANEIWIQIQKSFLKANIICDTPTDESIVGTGKLAYDISPVMIPSHSGLRVIRLIYC